MHLIVLDDDPRIAALVAALVRERRWSIDIAGNDAEFRSLYGSRVPDAILLDLQLGASDGIEQMRFLRESGYSGVIALMSGFDARVLASAQQLGQSFGLRIAGVLEKPARAAHIREVLDEIERHWLRTTSASSVQPDTSDPEAAIVQPQGIIDALRAGEMALYLQPILSAKDYSVIRLEALIRWHRPGGKMILPDRFIPSAEREQAVIDELTLWVIKTALDEYRRVAAHGVPIPIAVNLSGMNLRSLDFPDRLAALVAAAEAPPSALVLEITEGVAMHNSSTNIDILTRLRLKGFELAIDDLGTGYSSLKALKQIPFSEIKIDKSFVGDMLKSRESRAIVTSIIDLAKRMNLICIAEGVENNDTATQLCSMGIDCLQGYLYSVPLPCERAIEWLAQWTASHLSEKTDRSIG